jgi:hypothetical protein
VSSGIFQELQDVRELLLTKLLQTAVSDFGTLHRTTDVLSLRRAGADLPRVSGGMPPLQSAKISSGSSFPDDRRNPI